MKWFLFVALGSVVACSSSSDNKVKAKPGSGNAVSDEEKDSVVDAYFADRLPTVAAVTPPQGGALTNPSASIVVEFSEPIAPSSIDDAIRITQGDTTIEAALTASSSLVIITPVLPLDPALTYAVQVGVTVRDLNGQALAEAFTSSFTVIPLPPVIPPEAPVPATPSVSSFTALDDGSTQTVLAWQIEHPEEVQQSLVVRSFTATPASLTDGSVIHVGTATTVNDADRLHTDSYYSLFIQRKSGEWLGPTSAHTVRQFPLRVRVIHNSVRCPDLRGEVYAADDLTYQQVLGAVAVTSGDRVDDVLVFSGLPPDDYRVVSWRDCVAADGSPGNGEFEVVVDANNGVDCTAQCASGTMYSIDYTLEKLYTLNEPIQSDCGGQRLQVVVSSDSVTNVRMSVGTAHYTLFNDGGCQIAIERNASRSYDLLANDNRYSLGISRDDAVTGTYITRGWRHEAPKTFARAASELSELVWLDMPIVVATAPDPLSSARVPFGATPLFYEPGASPGEVQLSDVPVVSRVAGATNYTYDSWFPRYNPVGPGIDTFSTGSPPPAGVTPVAIPVSFVGSQPAPVDPVDTLAIRPTVMRIGPGGITAWARGQVHTTLAYVQAPAATVDVTGSIETDLSDPEFCPGYTFEGARIIANSCAAHGCATIGFRYYVEGGQFGYEDSVLEHTRYYSHADLLSDPTFSIPVREGSPRIGGVGVQGLFRNTAGMLVERNDFMFVTVELPAGLNSTFDAGTLPIHCPP